MTDFVALLDEQFEASGGDIEAVRAQRDATKRDEKERLKERRTALLKICAPAAAAGADAATPCATSVPAAPRKETRARARTPT